MPYISPENMKHQKSFQCSFNGTNCRGVISKRLLPFQKDFMFMILLSVSCEKAGKANGLTSVRHIQTSKKKKKSIM